MNNGVGRTFRESGDVRYYPRSPFALAAWGYTFCLLAMPAGLSAQSEPVASSGVVVEDVRKDSPSFLAGVQPGDVFQSWALTGGQKKNIISPFDWPEVARSSTNLNGGILLNGFSSRKESRTWSLASVIDIQVGPVLTGQISSQYHECTASALSGRFEESTICLRSVLGRVSEPTWLAPWLLGKIGELSAAQRRWSDVDNAFEDAINRAQRLDPQIASQLTTTWLNLTEQRYTTDLAIQRNAGSETPDTAALLDKLGTLSLVAGRFEPAERYFHDALVIRERLSPTSHAVAAGWDQLADIARLRGDLAKATDYLEKALVIEQKLGAEGPGVSIVLSKLGAIATARGDLTRAEQHYDRAINISTRTDPQGASMAAVLSGLAGVAHVRRELEKAEDLYSRALVIREKTLSPESLPIAELLDQLGAVTLMRGDMTRAQRYFERALKIQRTLFLVTPDLAVSLSGLGELASYRGDIAAAETYCTEALDIRQKLMPGSLAVASSLYQIGDISHRRGDWPKAKLRYEQAVTIFKQLAPRGPGTAMALFRLGAVTSLLGDPQKGEAYFKEAVALQTALAPGQLSAAMQVQSLGVLSVNRGGLEETYRYLDPTVSAYKAIAPGNESIEAQGLYLAGLKALDGGNFSAARDNLTRALAVNEKLAPNGLEAAMVLNMLGLAARGAGDLSGADKYLKRALTIEERQAPVSTNLALTLGNLGLIAVETGNIDMANVYFTGALALCEKLMPGNSYHASMLRAMGWISRERGHLDQAERYFGEAVSLLDGLTSRLGGSETARANFRSSRGDYYTDYIDTLLALNYPDRAFHALERRRARSLLAMMTERDSLLRRDMPAALEHARNVNAKAHDEVYEKLSQVSPQGDPAQLERLHARLRELNAERDQLAEQIRQASPRVAAVNYPQPLDLDATRKMLDRGTALLSYSVQNDRTVLFVVRPIPESPGISVFTAPVKEGTLRQQIDALRSTILERRTPQDPQFEAASRGLYDVLVKPAEPSLIGSERLLIIPDGVLNSLPFAALLRTPTQFLLEWKPIHFIVSATVFSEMKKNRTARSKPIDLVAFGDPRYSSNAATRSSAGSVSLPDAAERGLSLTPLVFSRGEVGAISSLYPSGRTRTYLGGEATEEKAKSLSTNVRYIHFAVHGILDNRFPLDSALAFSVPQPRGQSQDNGLLQAWEIFESMRIDADLVTLSACNTALGQEVSGEGIIGLLRAFEYAGAHSIIASLWAVDDLRTMDLMRDLYSGLRTGSTKDEALRQSQLRLLKQPASSSPYYWAAFSLTGDWR